MTTIEEVSLPGEEWALVPRYEGGYSVSTAGRVYSHKNDRLLTIHLDRHDYPSLRLSHLGKTRIERVATLMLEAFVGPRTSGMVVRHLNDVSSDTRLENLAWGTMSENRYDSVANGRHFHARLTHCKRGHKLEMPNLRKGALRDGRRGCLACYQEQCLARYHKREPDYAEADARYSRIMGGAKPEVVNRVRFTGKHCGLSEAGRALR